MSDKPKGSAKSKQSAEPKEPVSPTRSAQDKKREQSKAEFDRQVKEGSVTIRKMTPAERKANPPRERKPKRSR